MTTTHESVELNGAPVSGTEASRMGTATGRGLFPQVGDGSFLEADNRIHPEELQLAFRNKAIPLEGLRYDITPVGMHYSLIHFDVPFVDVDRWRLRIAGSEREPIELSLDELKRRPQRTMRVTIECAGDGRALTQPRSISQPWLTGAVGTAEWTGAPLQDLLDEAGIVDGDRDIVFTGLDRGFEGGGIRFFQRSLPLKTVREGDALVAYEMNGRPLEPQHGLPARLVIPGWYGMAHVKWLGAIESVPSPFEGYHQATAYHYTQSLDEVGDPVTLMRVRSLMIPPGVPDFLTRTRAVNAGKVELEGRAWSGRSSIQGVEVSTDAGGSWEDAEVEPSVDPYAWQRWTYTWNASQPGTYELCCRAHDSEGETQPIDQSWNAQGVGNNMVHKVPVVVV